MRLSRALRRAERWAGGSGVMLALLAACSSDDATERPSSVDPRAERVAAPRDGGNDASTTGDVAPPPVPVEDASLTTADGADGATRPDAISPTDGGSGQSNTTPELRTVRAEIDGPYGGDLDLTARGRAFILPRGATVNFVVFARDDTPASDLVVTVIDASGNAVPVIDEGLANGLWSVRVAASRGSQLSVQVTDVAGNSVTSFALTLPSSQEAITGNWVTRFFNADTIQSHTWTSTWTASDWSELQNDSGIDHGGTYSTLADELRVEERYRSGGGSNDADSTTVELDRRADFFVDSEWLSDSPYSRAQPGALLPDTWQRSSEVWVDVGGVRTLAEESTEVLVIGAGTTWSWTRIGTDHSAGASVGIDEIRSGTYRTESVISYSAGSVFFVGWTTDTIDGVAVTPGPEVFEQYVIRKEFLLLNPAERQP